MTTRGPAAAADVDWVRDAVFYQIFPDRFANGDRSLDPAGTLDWGSAPPTRDNFFGGDLIGVSDNLDHLTDLGASAIYFTPVFEAGTNHRYDTHDYLAIDPHLGGDRAFDVLLEVAHQRDIGIVLDAVFHHCGDGHPAFRDVVTNGPDSPYVNWFGIHSFPVTTDPAPNYGTCSGCHYLPRLNVDHPPLREHLLQVSRHWLERGIDGWRLDVPYMMDNPWFWQEFRTVTKSTTPGAYLVAEIWEKATDWVDGRTTDGAMNYRFRDAALAFIGEWRGGADQFAATLQQIDTEIPAPARGLMLNLLGSHDTERVLTHLGGDRDAARMALALMLACEGVPMIYYGDEIGMAGFNDPDCRAPMNWEQDAWDTVTLTAVRTAIQVRRDNIALRRGNQSVRSTFGEHVIALDRIHPDQHVVVVAHRGRSDRTIDLGIDTPVLDLATGDKVDGRAVPLLGQSVRLLELTGQDA